MVQYLTKLTQVKDTNTKKSLLYHVNAKANEAGIETHRLVEEFSCLDLVGQTDYEKMKQNLKTLEDSCKDSLAFVKLANYDSETAYMVSMFLQDAAKRILDMKKVTDSVLSEYKSLLDWFGIPKHAQSDYPPIVLAQILIDFAKDIKEVNTHLITERDQESRRKISFLDNVRKNSTSVALKVESKSKNQGPILDKSHFSSNLEGFLKLSLSKNS